MVRLGPDWTRILVTWRLVGTVHSAALAVVGSGADGARIDLDGVTLVGPRKGELPDLPPTLSREAELRAIDQATYMSVGPPVYTGTTGDLLIAPALMGAGAGFLAAFAGAAAAAAAARRGDQGAV